MTISFTVLYLNSPHFPCTALHCTALHCTALHCTALHCTELNWTELNWTELNWTELHCTALHCTAPQCNAPQCTAMQCNAMQCNAMQCNAMQCNAMQCNAMQCNAMQCTLFLSLFHSLRLLYSPSSPSLPPPSLYPYPGSRVLTVRSVRTAFILYHRSCIINNWFFDVYIVVIPGRLFAVSVILIYAHNGYTCFFPVNKDNKKC